MSNILGANLDTLYGAIYDKINVGDINPGLSRVLSGNESDDYMVSDKQQLGANITTGFESAALTGDFEVPAHLVALSQDAAIASLDPISVLTSVSANPENDFKGKAGYESTEFVTVGGVAYGDDTDVVKGFEAFDGSVVEPQVHFNVLYTALASVQDKAAELFLPVIPMGVNTSAASLSVRITNVLTDFKRGTTGAPAASSFNKKSLVKILNNPDEINVDRNRLVPVSKAENDAYLVSTVAARDVTFNGETVSTKPVKIGTDINLISLGTSDAMIAAGALDVTDALDPKVGVNEVYYRLTGKDDTDATVTEDFVFDISILNTAFTYSTTADSLDITLNTKLASLNINTTNTTAVGSDASAIIGNLPDGYDVQVSMKLVGDGNIQTGDIVIDATSVRLVGVTDASGAAVPATDAAYVTIKEVIDTLSVTGYTPESYLTNSNARINGLQLTSNKLTALYNVPFKTGDSIYLPVVKNGTQSDAEYLGTLNSQIGTGRWKLNHAAFKTITDFISFMEQSGDDVDIGGLSALFVNKAFMRDTLDLSTTVDSRESVSRRDAISASIALKVIQAANKLYLDSNYGVALETTQPGVKPTIIIMTDTVIGSYIKSEDFNNGMFNVKIETTISPYISGKVIFSFGIFDGKRNKEANVLNFGQCFKAADINISVPKTVNKGSRIENTVMHRFAHYINLPIMGVYDVTKIDEVIGKIVVNTKAV